MVDTRWQRIGELFASALEQTAAGREAFLDQHCGDDRELRDAVTALLEADADGHSLLDGVAADAVDLVGLVDLGEGHHVGPYRIVRPIGVGGMGAVYLAERADGQFAQTVALKIMRPGAAHSAERARRFRAERQLLAQLEHPAIARLIDGGVTSDGRPYFTMEYVDGVAIDRYCDDKRLSVAQRLQIFTRVLDAVAYAQQSLVVHRDLKPNNILVTEDGSVKLLDFGIAKVLAEDEAPGYAATQTVMAAMTPQYAAPEQVRGEPVTTATDVYALGIVLYELLTGARPYVLSSLAPAELDERICRTVPPAPSAVVAGEDDDTAGRFGVSGSRLARQLAGDLDNICAMAMRKEPARRYPSAQQMLDDIERHRAGWPVRARPDTFGYLAGKFLRRHTRPLLLALAVLLAIAGLLSFYTARLAEERDRAQREARKAEAVSGFLISLFQDADPAQAQGEQLTVRELLDRGAKRVADELDGQPHLEASILDMVGTVYDNLGAYDQADAAWTEALRIRRSLYDAHPELATSLHHLGKAKLHKGEYAAATPLLEGALAMRESLLPEDAPEIVHSLDDLARLAYDQGDIERATVLYRRAIDTANRGDPVSALSPMASLAVVLHARHDYQAAEQLGLEVLALSRQYLGAEHESVASTLHNLGQVLMDEERLEEAAALERESLALTRKLYGAGQHPREASVLAGLGRVLERQYDYQQAEEVMREAVAVSTRVKGELHPSTAYFTFDVGRVLAQRARYAEAERWYQRAMDILEEVVGSDYQQISFYRIFVAEIRYHVGDYDQAIAWYRRSLEEQRAYWGDAHPRVIRTSQGLAQALAATGAFEEAWALQESATARARERWGEGHRYHLQQLVSLAEITRQRGDLERAEELARRALEGQRALHGERHPETAQAMECLAGILLERGHAEPAVALYRDALDIRRAPAFEGHPDLANTLVGLARAYLASSDPAAAAPLLDEGLTILERTLPPTHPSIAAVRRLSSR